MSYGITKYMWYCYGSLSEVKTTSLCSCFTEHRAGNRSRPFPTSPQNVSHYWQCLFTIVVAYYCKVRSIYAPAQNVTSYRSKCGNNRKPICDFLLASNSNFLPILQRFRDIAHYRSYSRRFM